jgi:putative tricarboxylic transport membrane protein
LGAGYRILTQISFLIKSKRSDSVNIKQFIHTFRSAAVIVSFGAAFVLISAASMAQPVTWKPDSNIELVVPSGPGSGLDATARALQAIMQSSKLVSQPVTVVNKPGGGGTLAYLYINQRPGNGHIISVTSPGIITNKLVGSTDIDYRDVTPLAQLFDENIAFMVLPNSPIKSAQDLIDRLKKDPASLSFGIATVLGGANHIAAASALKLAGVDVARMRNVVFKSGGEVTTALLGGHLDVVPISVPVAVPQLQAGKIRVVAVSSAQRLPGVLASVPTWRELGVDSTYSSWRGIVGPKGLRPEVIAYWDALFAQLTSLDEWKKDLEKKLWVPNYLDSERSRAFLDEQRKEHHAILTDLGLAK